MKISELFRQKAGNARNIIFSGYEHDETDSQLTLTRLNEHIIRKNMRRIVIFSFVMLVIAVLYLVGGALSFPGESFIFDIVGSAVLILSAAAFIWLCSGELNRRVFDYGRMRLMVYVFWALFTLGMMAILLGEHKTGGCSAYFVFTAVSVCVPVMSLYESIPFALINAACLVVHGVINGEGFLYWVGSLAFLTAYVWIMSVVRGCFEALWLGEYRLGEAQERILSSSRTDTLTGMLNKWGLSARLDEIMEQLERTGDRTKIVVVLLDIDNFRYYNHMYGYEKSDTVLSRICGAIKIICKEHSDLISRFGGDEFVVIFRDKDPVEIVKLVEKLRQDIERMSVPFGGGIVTVSAGVSGSADLFGKQTYSKLLNDADDQLITAKQAGKNCIGFSGRAFINDTRREVEY